jgi:hypothetical protein
MAKTRPNWNQTKKTTTINVVICRRASHNSLQNVAHKLNQIIIEYGITISVQKTKSIAFKGRDTVRNKIVIDNKIIEEGNLFKF